MPFLERSNMSYASKLGLFHVAHSARHLARQRLTGGAAIAAWAPRAYLHGKGLIACPTFQLNCLVHLSSPSSGERGVCAWQGIREAARSTRIGKRGVRAAIAAAPPSALPTLDHPKGTEVLTHREDLLFDPKRHTARGA